MINIIPIPASQFFQMGYILHDPDANEGLIVDPGADTPTYMPEEMRIQAVINTHIHFDHTLGNHYFRDNAPILAHPAEASWYYRLVNAAFCTLFSRHIPPRVTYSLKEGMYFNLGGENVTVLHTPGHSAGSICLYWSGNLISGDTIFSGGVGRVDVPLSNPADMKASLRRLLELPENTMIWPGHAYDIPYPITLAANRRVLVWAMNTL